MKPRLLVDDLRVIFEDGQPPLISTTHEPEFYKTMCDMRWSWFLGGAEAVLEAMGKSPNLYITKASAQYEPKNAETTPVRPQPREQPERKETM